MTSHNIRMLFLRVKKN